MPLLNIVVGAALLLLGRRLFWLFVAGVGFVVGTLLATQWLGGTPDGIAIIIALGIGIVGAVVSVFLQRLMVAAAGFLAGGYLFYTLAFGLRYESVIWIAFLVGGVIGAMLVLALFDWALISLSALIGATVISQNVSVEQPLATMLFLVLLGLGVITQARPLMRATSAPR